MLWQDYGDESLDGDKHDGVDTEKYRNVSNDGVERTQAESGRPYIDVQLLGYPHGHEATKQDVAWNQDIPCILQFKSCTVNIDCLE